MMENKLSQFYQALNLERVQELETWLKETNTKLTQVNGQRKYGGPPEVWDGPAPGKRCEVFISQIPRDAYEDLLIPLFSSVGPLWEFRLMMNFSGENRGFAYAKYGSSNLATTAIRLLNGHMMEPGLRLSVRRSIEKRHLSIWDLPASTEQNDLLQVLRLVTEGVERVSLKTGPGFEGVSAIVAFSSHHAASMAKKMLVEVFKKQFALTISIKWQSKVKPSSDEALPPMNSKYPMLPSLKQSSNILNFPQPSDLPPHLARPTSSPRGFCRAVGGPAAPQHPPKHSITSSPFKRGEVSVASPVILLHWMCEAAGFGQPQYEINISHTGPDGYLYFTYKVWIPGINMAFEGVDVILPRPTNVTTIEEAKQAAANQILQKVNHTQYSE